MGIFEPIVLSWKGKELTVEPNHVMAMIAKIEDILTLQDLQETGEGKPKFAKIAMAYGSALRHAGHRCEDDEIYSSLFSDSGMGAVEAISSLMLMMVPPDVIQAEGSPEKKDEAPQ